MTGGMVEPVKIFLSSSQITMPNLVTMCHTMWAHVRGPENIGCWVPHFLYNLLG